MSDQKLNFSEEELIGVAHYRMLGFKLSQALEFVSRPEVTEGRLRNYILRRFESIDAFFARYGPIVHTQRKAGLLPEKKPAKKKKNSPKNKTFIFGRGPYARGAH